MERSNADHPTPEPRDADLMERVRAGRRDAFECLVRRHQQPLLNFFSRMGAYTEAEDLVQETFVRLFRYRDRYRPSAKFTTFLYTLARHAWLDLLRKSRKGEILQERIRAEAPDGHDGGIGRARLGMDTQAALDALPEKLRSVVVLSFLQGLRYDEIAGVLKIPTGTVKSRMFTALDRLKGILGHD